MAERIIRVCDRDEKVIDDDAALGDHAGGPVTVKFAGYARKMELCSDCVQELHAWLGDAGVMDYSGAARGTLAQLTALTVIED
jgi:hypothetical protein